MRIDIWSDVVCPFCYLGKRNLELALAQFEHRDQVEVVWHSFELDTTAHEDPEMSLAQKVASKYGMSLEQAEESQRDIARRSAEVGLEFNWEIAKYGNTFDAHRLIHLATSQGLASQAQEAFKKAYFTQGRSVEDRDSLREIASEIGLASADVERVLASDEFADAVRADERTARELGINGVPFFLLEYKWAINGAQPVDSILAALKQVWDELHPEPRFMKPVVIPPVPGSEDASVCGPEGCEPAAS